VRERRDVQQLQYERGIVPNPVAHHNASPRFVTRTISFATSKGLVQTWRRARRGADQTNRPQPLPKLQASPLKLQPAQARFRSSSVTGLHVVPPNIDSDDLSSQTGHWNSSSAISAAV
jgi:hypothetical protein